MAGNMSMLKVFQKKKHYWRYCWEKNIEGIASIWEIFQGIASIFLKILIGKIWYSKSTHILILIVTYHSYNVQTCEGEYEYGEGTFLFPVPLFSFITYKL